MVSISKPIQFFVSVISKNVGAITDRHITNKFLKVRVPTSFYGQPKFCKSSHT
ncbi:hypothetical protein LEP1GSC041_1415 [Leptospira noguchii str. 2006001870]|nr:hypothetical protein LEP1GSC041_1415 [Leptospira noguchii str. 2006001870]